MPKHKKQSNGGQKGVPRYSIVVALLVGFIIGQQASCNFIFSQRTSRKEKIVVRFSPNGGCIALIQQYIANAKKSILVQAYYFTSTSLAQSLIQAHQRGVEVKILMDRSQRRRKDAQLANFRAHGIPVWIDKVSGIAHNKIMLIDDTYVITGSFNWTNSAETRNAENILCISDLQLNKVYKEEWYKRAKTAAPVE